MIQSNTLRIKEGRTLLTVDHNGEELTFAHPHYGLGTYFQVGDQIQKAGLCRPTMAQTAEWLDVYFKKEKGKLYIASGHKIVNNKLQPQKYEELKDCLLEDRNPGIVLDYLIKIMTTQGLPPANTPKGSLYYRYPRKDSVARFEADSDGVRLDCYWNPGSSYSWLGVRGARKISEPKENIFLYNQLAKHSERFVPEPLRNQYLKEIEKILKDH